MQHIICFIKTVCILGGMSSNGPSTKYFWNEGNGWEYGGDMKHPRYGHVAVTQASSVRTNDFERPRSNFIPSLISPHLVPHAMDRCYILMRSLLRIRM